MTAARKRGRCGVKQPRGGCRVLIWSPNYAREPIGIPPLVTDAAERFVRRGHSVDIVTAAPNYPERRIHPEYRGVSFRTETLNGVRIHRSWLLARAERSFADKALYELTISTFALPNAIRLERCADGVVCVVPTLLAAPYAAGLALPTHTEASLRQRPGDRAREHGKQYDWGRVGAEFVRIYRDVVTTSKGQRDAA